MASPETWLPLNKQLIRTKIHSNIFITTIVFKLFSHELYIAKTKELNFKGSTQVIYFGMAEKYHIVGRYGGHKWHGFWLKVFGCTRSISSQYKVWASKVV